MNLNQVMEKQRKQESKREIWRRKNHETAHKTELIDFLYRANVTEERNTQLLFISR